MVESATHVADDAQLAQLTDEVRQLRAELRASRATSARALARATRLAQLVSVLGQLTDVTDVLEGAVREVAEQFSADIAVILTPVAEDAGVVRLAAQWGFSANRLPPETLECPALARQLTPVAPAAAGPVADLRPPDWLLATRPRHLAWGLLPGRAEDLGYLLLARRANEPFEPADVQELGAVVGRVALALDNSRLYRRAQEQLHRLSRLHEVTSALAAIVDLDSAVQSIAEMLVAEVPVTGAAVYLAREHGHELAAVAGAVGDVPGRVDGTAAVGRPDVEFVALGSGTACLGGLLLTGAPEPGSEAGSFLEHLIDIGGLALERALLFARIRTQAETDALTGLPNRSLFMQRLSDALTRCHRAESDLAVVFVDLDGFKAINDTHGHDAGDQVLIHVARRLKASVRPPDTVARLGGDEFVVLCEDTAPDEVDSLVVARIQRAVDEPCRVERPSGAIEVDVGASIGVGRARDAGYDASALLRSADSAMYAAKQRRRSSPVWRSGTRAGGVSGWARRAAG